MSDNLKKPTDYPQFYFRISEKDKVQIERLAEGIIKKMNNKKSAGIKKAKRNELLAQALLIGLSILNE